MRRILLHKSWLIIFLLSCGCAGKTINLGNYYQGYQMLEILPDSIFKLYDRVGHGISSVGYGNWDIQENELFLKADTSNVEVLKIKTRLTTSDNSEDALIIYPKIGEYIKVEVINNSRVIAELSAKDSVVSLKDVSGELYFKAFWAMDMFPPSPPLREVLYSRTVELASVGNSMTTVVSFQVRFNDFFRKPIVNDTLKIRTREKLYSRKLESTFYWDDPLK